MDTVTGESEQRSYEGARGESGGVKRVEIVDPADSFSKMIQSPENRKLRKVFSKPNFSH